MEMHDSAGQLAPPPRALFAQSAPSPCFVLDLARLRANLAILDDVQKAAGVKILLALKAFAAFHVFPMLSRAHNGPLWGTCASSVHEARLGKEEFGGEVHAFAAAWSQEEMAELLQLADHIVFNSLQQWRQFTPMIASANATFRKHAPIDCGLRLNPECNTGATAIYNPCDPASRLGIRPKDLAKVRPEQFANLDGLHFHTLCEQGAEPLAETLEAFEKKFSAWLPGRKWLNWGGGHHITKPGYNIELLKKLLTDWRQRRQCQIYLEPGEAVALDAGWLTATVLDIVDADMPVAMLDASAACHMPDVLEMPYTPNVWYETADNILQAQSPENGAYKARLAGKSCLAGDVIGEYGFDRPLKIGDRLVFGDMAIYSMVKTNTFNGLGLPSIAVYDGQEKLQVIRQFGYEDFKGRLS